MNSDPSMEEIERVGAYWRKVEALTCRHDAITYGGGGEVTCTKCDRPVRLMSDIQIENLAKPDATVVGARGVEGKS